MTSLQCHNDTHLFDGFYHQGTQHSETQYLSCSANPLQSYSIAPSLMSHRLLFITEILSQPYMVLKRYNHCWCYHVKQYGYDGINPLLSGMLWTILLTGLNSLAPGRCGNKFTSLFFKLILLIDISSTSCEIGHWWVPYNLINDKSTLLVQMRALCHQATSHCLSKCWPCVTAWHH